MNKDMISDHCLEEGLKILIVVPHYLPEIGSAAHIYADLAAALASRGNKVDVITSYPRDFNLDEKDKKSEYPLNETINGVDVHRCQHSSVRDNVIMRGMEHFLLPRQYFSLYKQLDNKFDVCLIYIPPLPLYSFGKKIRKRDRTPFVLNYQDFHPQELTDVGVMKNRLLIKFMEIIEKRSYNSADHIVLISDGGRDYILRRGCSHDRMTRIYNGALTSNFQDTKRDFKQREGLQDKFLVTYAGILSPFQGLDNILDAASAMRSHQDVIFYIVGDGMARVKLIERATADGLNNVRFLPLQPRAEYQNIVASSDICIAALDLRMKAPCFPGKMVNLTGSGKAIVAIVPEDSETSRVINKEQIGLVVEPGDTKSLMDAILKVKEDPHYRKGLEDKAKAFFEENMDFDRTVSSFESIFKGLLKQNGKPLPSKEAPRKVEAGEGL